MLSYADVLLPLAPFAENEGSYINVEGLQQSFQSAVSPQAEARPGWKVLRVLGNKFALQGYQYESLSEVSEEMRESIGDINIQSLDKWVLPTNITRANGNLQRLSDVPTNSVDSVVRRAKSLQMTNDTADGAVHINSTLANKLGLSDQEIVRAEQNDVVLTLPLVLDERLPDSCVLIQAKHEQSAPLGAWFADITLGKA